MTIGENIKLLREEHAIGIPDQYIMEQGGWKSDAILKSVYRNTLGDMKKKNDGLINQFLNNSMV